MSKKLIFLDLDQTIICNSSQKEKLSDFQKKNMSSDTYAMQVTEDGLIHEFNLLHQALHISFFSRLGQAISQGKAEFRVMTAAIYPEKPVVEFLSKHFNAGACLAPDIQHRVINRSNIGDPFSIMSAVNDEMTGEGKPFFGKGNLLFGMTRNGVWVDKVVQTYFLLNDQLKYADQDSTDIILIDDSEKHRTNMQIMNYSAMDSTKATYSLEMNALLDSLGV
ncbi:hypothetical protein [Pelagibaculum spongiae]|uniref:Uncharacterized protein n=1 Tax=Pelagibaculum spongiae TaxID=2080658 RepID=A0A2V1H5V8_9GAMM|nr:hypothetical protein [Pelagibaculum spongiae]PVZ71812.1 hypothetical protein DC094_01940 [Pelagibaculum spongiae]